jgi:hypothetical protein
MQRESGGWNRRSCNWITYRGSSSVLNFVDDIGGKSSSCSLWLFSSMFLLRNFSYSGVVAANGHDSLLVVSVVLVEIMTKHDCLPTRHDSRILCMLNILIKCSFITFKTDCLWGIANCIEVITYIRLHNDFLCSTIMNPRRQIMQLHISNGHLINLFHW